MGLAPIVAGVSIFGAVSQYSAQRNQAAAAAAGVSANKKAAEAEAAIRRAQIAAQQMQVDYQSTLNSLSRQAATAQLNAGLRASEITDNIEMQKRTSAIGSARLQNEIQRETQRSQIETARVQNAVQGAEGRSEAQRRAGLVSEQILGQVGQAGQRMSEGERRAASMRALTGAAGLQQSETDVVNQNQEIMSQVAEALGLNYDAMTIQEQNQLQLAFDTFMANAQEQAGGIGLDYQAQTAENQANLTAQQLGFAEQETGLLSQILASGRNTAKEQFGYSSIQDEMTNRANQLFAQQGLQMQTRGVDATLGAQMASLDAQRAQINAQTPGLFQLLPSLIGASQPLLTGLFNQRSIAPQSAATPVPQQQLFSGFRVPEYTDVTSPFNRQGLYG